jgi:Divergent InlB B-repeat domain
VPEGQPASYYVVYGLQSSEWCTSEGRSGLPEQTSPTAGPTGTSEFEVASLTLKGLSPGTKYCAEMVASNTAGSERGGQVRFTAGAPSAFAAGAHSTSATTATVDGEVDPAGQSTEYFVEYGPASSPWCTSKGLSGTAGGTTKAETLPPGPASVPVTVSLTGLTPGAEYCAELVAKNGVATERSAHITLVAGAPVAETSLSVLVTTTTASLGGLIDPSGQPTSYYVEFGLATSQWCESFGRSGAPEHTTLPQALGYQGESLAAVSVELTALTPGTGYCAELVASNTSATSHGGQVEFSTRPVYALSVSLAGNGAGRVTGSGISCPGACSSSYPGGTKVTLTAAAAAGSTFSGWSGACSGTGACNVTMSAARQVAASFTANPAPAPVPPPTPNSGFTLKGNPRVNPKTGAVTFTASVSYPGVFSWLLSFKNGSFGIISARSKGCRRGQLKLKGKCRSAQIIFGKGSKTAAKAGSVSFTVAPSAAARNALRAALKEGTGLLVNASVTFKATGSASSVSHTRSLNVQLKPSSKGKHKR